METNELPKTKHFYVVRQRWTKKSRTLKVMSRQIIDYNTAISWMEFVKSECKNPKLYEFFIIEM